MGRDIGPKCKICRREGMKLYLKGDRCDTTKCAFTRKPYPPGEHGKQASYHMSGYYAQLRAKQTLKRIFGIRERELKKLYKIAKKDPKDKSTRLLALLEMRLDNVVYKLGFASSRTQARQIITHGFVKVDGKKVDRPSFQVKPNQEITISEKIKNLNWYKELEAKHRDYIPPKWLSVKESGVGVVVSEPTRDMMEQGVREDFVIEFYSR
jgi:small subunit ribosomal protein S4